MSSQGSFLLLSWKKNMKFECRKHHKFQEMFSHEPANQQPLSWKISFVRVESFWDRSSVGESWLNQKVLIFILIKFNFIYIMLVYKSHDI